MCAAGVALSRGSGAWARSQRTVESGEPILVSGTLEERDGLQIRVNSAERLADARARTTREVTFSLSSEELTGKRLERFTRLLQDHPGTCAARVVVTVPGRFQATLGLPRTSVDAGAPFEEHLLSLFGRHDAVVLR